MCDFSLFFFPFVFGIKITEEKKCDFSATVHAVLPPFIMCSRGRAAMRNKHRCSLLTPRIPPFLLSVPIPLSIRHAGRGTKERAGQAPPPSFYYFLLCINLVFGDPKNGGDSLFFFLGSFFPHFFSNGGGVHSLMNRLGVILLGNRFYARWMIEVKRKFKKQSDRV